MDSDDLAAAIGGMALQLQAGEDDETKDETIMADMPAEIARRVLGLKKLQAQSESISEEYRKERLALEAKYRLLKEPLYAQRLEIVSGDVEPTLTPDEESEIVVSQVEEEDAIEIKGIPGFWAQCLTNSTMVSDFVTEDDIAALNHLTDIQCAYTEDMSSFTLSFFFSENEFFSDSVLTKTYELSTDLLDEQSPSLSKIVGCDVHWKAPEKNLCVGIVQKKQKGKSGKRKGQIRFVSREEPKPSFFHYFGDPIDEDEEEEEEEEDGEEKERIKLSVEDDYEIGHFVRTDVIPNAVLWFTGEAIDDDDEDFEEEGEEDEEDEGDDDDDDEVEGQAPTKNARGGPKGPAAAPAETPECKQN